MAPQVPPRPRTNRTDPSEEFDFLRSEGQDREFVNDESMPSHTLCESEESKSAQLMEAIRTEQGTPVSTYQPVVPDRPHRPGPDEAIATELVPSIAKETVEKNTQGASEEGGQEDRRDSEVKGTKDVAGDSIAQDEVENGEGSESESLSDVASNRSRHSLVRHESNELSAMTSDAESRPMTPSSVPSIPPRPKRSPGIPAVPPRPREKSSSAESEKKASEIEPEVKPGGETVKDSESKDIEHDPSKLNTAQNDGETVPEVPQEQSKSGIETEETLEPEPEIKQLASENIEPKSEPTEIEEASKVEPEPESSGALKAETESTEMAKESEPTPESKSKGEPGSEVSEDTEAKPESEPEAKSVSVAEEATGANIESKIEPESTPNLDIQEAEGVQKAVEPEQTAKPIPVIPKRPSRSQSKEPSSSDEKVEKAKPEVPERPARPSRPAVPPRPNKLHQMFEQQPEENKRPVPPPKPKRLPNSKVGALQASLFKDLDRVMSSGAPFGAPRPPSKADPEPEQEQEESEKAETSTEPASAPALASRRRAKGPKGRRLPTEAKDPWTTTIRPMWSLRVEPEPKQSTEEELNEPIKQVEQNEKDEQDEQAEQIEQTNQTEHTDRLSESSEPIEQADQSESGQSMDRTSTLEKSKDCVESEQIETSSELKKTEDIDHSSTGLKKTEDTSELQHDESTQAEQTERHLHGDHEHQKLEQLQLSDQTEQSKLPERAPGHTPEQSEIPSESKLSEQEPQTSQKSGQSESVKPTDQSSLHIDTSEPDHTKESGTPDDQARGSARGSGIVEPHDSPVSDVNGNHTAANSTASSGTTALDAGVGRSSSGGIEQSMSSPPLGPDTAEVSKQSEDDGEDFSEP
uniref:ARAD1C08514p n=1 Tax=Blastobotrys adeninivorans TaxID=409370 RepID=A0A060T5V9_BLAAD